MGISDKRLLKIWELEAGAAEAGSHCVYNTNDFYYFRCGLQAAMDILNAPTNEEAASIAASIKERWIDKTGTTAEQWTTKCSVDKDTIGEYKYALMVYRHTKENKR